MTRRRYIRMIDETPLDKWRRKLTDNYGFDSTWETPGTADVLAVSIVQGRLDPKSKEMKRIFKRRKAHVMNFYRQYCEDNRRQPASRPNFTASEEGQKAIDLETKDYEDKHFRRDNITDIFKRYYYGDLKRYSKEEEAEFKEMELRSFDPQYEVDFTKIAPSKRTRSHYGK